MEIRPNRVKQKLAAGENVYIAGFSEAEGIDKFGPVGFDGV